MKRHDWDGVERRDEPATSGAQEQLDEIRRILRVALVAMAVGGMVWVATASYAIWRTSEIASDASDAVATAEAERAARAQSVKGVITLFCGTDNEQDTILADLLRVTVEGNTQFGEGVEPTSLAPFDLQVLTAIVKVQQLQRASGTDETQAIFTAKLRELEDLLPCERIVRLYLAGEQVPTVEELGIGTTTRP